MPDVNGAGSIPFHRQSGSVSLSPTHNSAGRGQHNPVRRSRGARDQAVRRG